MLMTYYGIQDFGKLTGNSALTFERAASFAAQLKVPVPH